ncbi:hypothetical protein BDV95DRAFT_609382 [Massariosphaeria phaeospora]|uniref:Uncharacterized protein n=1 Tax=Massariosphaeria phaeospora TaxID=100035 RepID=A0A7C8I4F9_9PLEO|nr:hypothetical protein BDV95DRAFT_609382 [Massariosphaeria phaeospora]
MASKIQRHGNGAGDGEVSSCVYNLIHAFTNGLDIFKRLRERRRKRKHHKPAAPPDSSSSAELQLSSSLRRGPMDLQTNYEQHYGKAGNRFANGDAIAHASLAETLIKLNTGLVGIISAFLNHDSKSSRLDLDYKSLTNLSNSSRVEAISSMNQLYQRLSQSQLHVYRISGCAQCGSNKHQYCSGDIDGNSAVQKHRATSSDKRRQSNSRSRVNGPTITRMPIRSSDQPQLVVVRPKPGRKGSSSGSSSSSTKAQSTAHNSPYASPPGSPLPQYAAVDPLSVPKSPPPKAKSSPGRSKANSVDGPRPVRPPARPNKIHVPEVLVPKDPDPAKTSRLTKEKEAGIKRRIDKVTPSMYTIASASTKLGEIPQNRWNQPWDYTEAERLNAEALINGYLLPATESKPKAKKGLFKFLKRGGGEAG